MKVSIKEIAREILPPFTVKLYRKIRKSFDRKEIQEPKHREPDEKHKYLHCEILYSRLTFEEDHLRPHCWRDSADFLPKFPYNGEKLSRGKMASYLRHIAGVMDKEPERCEKCINAYYDTKPQKPSVRKLKIKTLMINPHRYHCNIKCNYCWWHGKSPKNDAKKPYSVLEAVNFLIRAGMIDDGCTFSWGGGESTILPEFNTLARLIYDKGYNQTMNTNGTVYSEVWAYVLSKNVNTYVNISVDSGTAETYKNIKGADYFNLVWTNIKKYQLVSKSKSSLRVKYIVMACNRERDELEKFIQKCLEAGVKNIEYSVDGEEIALGLSKETIAQVACLKALAIKNNLCCENAVFWNNSVAEILDKQPLPEV